MLSGRPPVLASPHLCSKFPVRAELFCVEESVGCSCVVKASVVKTRLYLLLMLFVKKKHKQNQAKQTNKMKGLYVVCISSVIA